MERTPASSLALDRDDGELHRRMAELRAALRAGDQARIATILAGVCDHVGAHFDGEEQAMLATGYPHYQVHRAAHARLHREVRALADEWTAKGVTPDLAESVLDALSEWFELHVRELDAQLFRHLAAAPGERAAARPPSAAWPAPPPGR